MKNYIKLGFIAFILSPTSLVLPAEGRFEEYPNPEHPFKTEENHKAIGRMIYERHSALMTHPTDEIAQRTKKEVQVPGITQRISDWFSDWWNDSSLFGTKNKSRRTLVENRFKDYSKSNDPNKKIFQHGEELDAQKAFQKLRPDLQLEYVNDFVKLERKKFETQKEELHNTLKNLQKTNESLIKQRSETFKEFKELLQRTYPEKTAQEINNLLLNDSKQLHEMISEFKSMKHRVGNQTKLIQLFDDMNTLTLKIQKNDAEMKDIRSTKYLKLHTDYFDRINKFREEIDDVLKRNSQNIHLKYNLKTNSFEFHTQPETSNQNPESRSNFFRRSEETNPSDLTGKSQDRIEAEQRQKELDELQKRKEEEVAQEHNRKLQEIQQQNDFGQPIETSQNISPSTPTRPEPSSIFARTANVDHLLRHFTENDTDGYDSQTSTDSSLTSANQRPTVPVEVNFEDTLEKFENAAGEQKRQDLVQLHNDLRAKTSYVTRILNTYKEKFPTRTNTIETIERLITTTRTSQINNSENVQTLKELNDELDRYTQQMNTEISRENSNDRQPLNPTNPEAQRSYSIVSNPSTSNDLPSEYGNLPAAIPERQDNENDRRNELTATNNDEIQPEAQVSSTPAPAPKKSAVDELRETLQAQINQLEKNSDLMYGDKQKLNEFRNNIQRAESLRELEDQEDALNFFARSI